MAATELVQEPFGLTAPPSSLATRSPFQCPSHNSPHTESLRLCLFRNTLCSDSIDRICWVATLPGLSSSCIRSPDSELPLNHLSPASTTCNVEVAYKLRVFLGDAKSSCHVPNFSLCHILRLPNNSHPSHCGSQLKNAAMFDSASRVLEFLAATTSALPLFSFPS